mmetsp:Transcript_8303/g.25816  ORF Transcript_8303/g.25816 Transcript_8303/m.25816 type:complete len:204 (-) Transcript_8303:563-1174(-)
MRPTRRPMWRAARPRSGSPVRGQDQPRRRLRRRHRPCTRARRERALPTPTSNPATYAPLTSAPEPSRRLPRRRSAGGSSATSRRAVTSYSRRALISSTAPPMLPAHRPPRPAGCGTKRRARMWTQSTRRRRVAREPAFGASSGPPALANQLFSPFWRGGRPLAASVGTSHSTARRSLRPSGAGGCVMSHRPTCSRQIPRCSST